ncbi:hypothetical protein HOO54_12645 [Bacillus sp. WMMC1349]|uniref:hypothetical protein n=1 Tax=Bacillus sp. WMMC1349 TaxID=2736254 RepID=UPI0015526D01|nr:hypothetical protein [Bacillus sp. WMMC1349]NPC93057.1 hypothetical protein [Bacillus sp. WMMC1349]
MKKNWILFLMSAVLVFALAACQQDKQAASNSKPTLKESYTSAYKKLFTADTYEFTSKVNLKLDIPEQTAIDQEILESLNNSEFTIDGKMNKKTKEVELSFKGKIKVKGQTLDLDIPVYLDQKKQLGYIKADSFAENFGVFVDMPGLKLNSFKGKYLEFSLNDGKKDTGETDTNQKLVMDYLRDSTDKLPESKLKKEELTDTEKKQGAAQKIVISYSDQEAKASIENAIELLGENSEEIIKKDELKDEFKNMTFKKFDLTTTLDKKENLLTETGDISLVTKQDSSKRATIGLTFQTLYKNLNGNVTFSAPKKEDIVKEDEIKDMVKADVMKSQGF